MGEHLFDDLDVHIRNLADSMRGNYDGHQHAVLQLIDETRATLVREFGLIAVWETSELDSAEEHARRNRLILALTAVSSALTVSRLGDDEYWGGLSYTKPGIERGPRRLR